MRKQRFFNELRFSMIYITHMAFTLLSAKWQPRYNHLETKLLPATAKYRVDN